MASEIKIEPGPWEQWNAHVSGRKAVTTIKAADRKTICTLADGTDEWVNAHGRLLKAAPELYDVLSLALAGGEHDESCPGQPTVCHCWISRARAVLAKVRGEVPRG